MTTTNTTCSVKEWNRKTWHNKSEVPGTNLFRTEMLHNYEGVIKGEGSIQYLIAESTNCTGNMVAMEKVIGSIDGKSGSFVFQHIGTFDHGKITITLMVLPGSGTDELSGLHGQATLESELHQEVYPFHFAYSFEETKSPEG